MVTNEQVKAGMEKHIGIYRQIEKMGHSDGTKETVIKLIREICQDYGWNSLNTLLIVLARNGYISGIHLDGDSVLEPIKPKLTDKALKELKGREQFLKSME